MHIFAEGREFSEWNDLISAVRSARQVKKVSLLVKLPKDFEYSCVKYQELEGFELQEILLKRWKCDGKRVQ